MSTVHTTQDYECRQENKGTDLVLVPIESIGCINETTNTMRYLQYQLTLSLSTHKMLIRAHTEHISTTSPCSQRNSGL
jgi:hypothetical protein